MENFQFDVLSTDLLGLTIPNYAWRTYLPCASSNHRSGVPEMQNHANGVTAVKVSAVYEPLEETSQVLSCYPVEAFEYKSGQPQLHSSADRQPAKILCCRSYVVLALAF